MMTPQTVQDKRFEKAVFGGYDMAGVDEFLEQLTVDYTALFKENAVLKNKLKVLIDTVEEYRSVDEAMRRTLFSAQRTADGITKEAQAKAEEILYRANADAAESVQRLRTENGMEQARHKVLKEQTESFIRRLMEAYTKQMESVNSLKTQVFQESASVEAVSQTAQEISKTMQSKLSDEQPAAETLSASPLPDRERQAAFELSLKDTPGKHFTEEDAEDTVPSRPRFDFPDLQSQFGQQYSAK